MPWSFAFFSSLILRVWASHCLSDRGLTPQSLWCISKKLLHTLLEHGLIKPVSFIIVPIFGFANAGVDFTGLGIDAVFAPVRVALVPGLANKLIQSFWRGSDSCKGDIVDLPASARAGGGCWERHFFCGIRLHVEPVYRCSPANDVLLRDGSKDRRF
ncbi:hypothetical protein HED48_22520 [Ochrobactrum intermedium]|nr:hypothetical protein [Brucella intermedia]